MDLFQQLITLSKSIAASLLKDEKPNDLEQSELFSDADKKYIENQLTDKKLIKKRLSLSNQIETKKDWKKIQSRIKQPKTSIRRWKYAGVAAMITILLSTTYLFKNQLFQNDENNIVAIENIIPGQNKAVLTLANGKEVALTQGDSIAVGNAKSDGDKIVYTKNSAEEVAFNQLTVPKGGQFFIELSDGTKVWLNSDSKIKYQVSFIGGKTRQVELVYGEAYFDVSPSTKHQGSKFVVYHKKQQIQVLGTQFNVKAYNDDSTISTTLVEGKVALTYNTNKKIVMTPNERVTYDPITHVIELKKVDIYNEISWKDGVFSFEDKSLKEIMKVLSRWYDVEIVFNDKNTENEEFVGVLGKDQNLESILKSIKSYGIIKNYKLADHKVVLY